MFYPVVFSALREEIREQYGVVPAERPPTQSQNSNMLLVSMPNSATFSELVETATKCRTTRPEARVLTRHSDLLRHSDFVNRVFANVADTA